MNGCTGVSPKHPYSRFIFDLVRALGAILSVWQKIAQIFGLSEGFTVH